MPLLQPSRPIRLAHTAALLLALLGLLLMAVPPPAHAQTCTADIQCLNGGRPRAECIGDTLIVRRAICAGTCRDTEDRRQTCGSRGIGGRCVGHAFETVTGRCNAALATCDTRTERTPCFPSCSCRGRQLIVASGQCSPATGCQRAVITCARGCTCDPTPRCLDE